MDHPEIPTGVYCYTYVKNSATGEDEFKVCPYWSKNHDKPSQENGYCSFLKKGDWEMRCSLLWDQCKECNINMDIDPADLS